MDGPFLFIHVSHEYLLLLMKFYREFLENEGPIMSEKTKRKAISAHQVVQDILSQTGLLSNIKY